MKFQLIIFFLALSFSLMICPAGAQTSQVLSLSEKQDSAKADGFVDRAQASRDAGRFDEALKFLDLALILRNHLADSSGVANIYAVQSTIFLKRGNQAKAISVLLDAIRLHEAIGDLKNAALDYNLLGNIYEKQQDDAKAEANFLKALAIFENLEAVKNEEYAASLMINLSDFYLEQNQTEKALEYGEKSAEIYHQLKSKAGLALSNFSIGNTYLKGKNNDLAENYYLEALDSLAGSNYPSLEAQIHNQLSKVYLHQGQFNKAMGFAEQAMDFFKASGLKNDLKGTYLTLSKIYESKNQPNRALQLYKQYLDLAEADFNEESKRIEKELLTKYDSEKKEAEIKLLEQERKITEGAIKKQRFQIVSFAIFGLLLALLAAGLIYYNRSIQKAKDQIAREKERSENLLLNILPEDVASELKTNGKYRARSFPEVSVLFADIAGFTKHAEHLSPGELVKNIDAYFSAFDEIVGHFKMEKIKTIGDAYMVAGGLLGDPKNVAVKMVQMGLAFQEKVKEINLERSRLNEICFEMRLGLHTGPVVAGIVGSRKFAYDIWGDTVNIASRMQSSGQVNKLNISEVTFQLVKDEFECMHRGKIEVKNKDAIEMYFVSSKKRS